MKNKFPEKVQLSSLKKSLFFAICIILPFSPFQENSAQTPQVRYSFNAIENSDSIFDETGNGYNAKLIGSAKIIKLAEFNLLKTGSTNGYVDLGSKIGQLINSLSDFSISTYLYIDPSLNLSNNGNFVWTFSNSANISTSARGCMFYTAKNSRYAICPTNYRTEESVSVGVESEKGSWKHVTYTQSGTIGKVYIDGVLRKTSTINMLPKDLGITDYNYLCKSSYSSDQILLNSMLCDFRIYNTALSATQISALTTNLAALDTATYNDFVDSALVKLSLGDLSAVTNSLTLPLNGENSTSIEWTSSNTAIISNSGHVTRPAYGSSNAVVTLTATVSKKFVSKTKTFIATVLPSISDQEAIIADANNLSITGNINNLRSDITLPTSGMEGSTITWSSNNPSVLSNNGSIITRPTHGSGSQLVQLTANIIKGTSSTTKIFNIFIAEDEGFSAYLFAYFTGNNGSQESIRFALSDDGFTFKALNNDNPVINSSTISSSGGVRDPHILRGENNEYYMVVTDMVSALGWNSNRAMVLLKSTDLTNWTSSVINIPNTFSQYASADRVWAPQTIYDPVAKKYMVYFSMRLGPGDYDKIYYAYANSSFTALENAPQILFDNNGYATIDGDIVLKDGVYNLFFKTEGNGNGIKKATSTNLTNGYVLYDKYLQSTTNAVEGGCVYRMYNTDNWILMYDMYTSGAYQFTESIDLQNFSVVPNTVSFDFTPRHGTIIPITSAEEQALNAKWGNAAGNGAPKTSPFTLYPNPGSNFIRLSGNDDLISGTRIQIFDTQGRKVIEKNLISNNTEIDVSSLISGIYLIQSIGTDGKIFTSTFKKI